jgi:hypothetical protein
MLGIGVGIVHWAKTLMPDHELTEDRHAVTDEKDRAEAEQIVGTILDESGIKRRPADPQHAARGDDPGAASRRSRSSATWARCRVTRCGTRCGTPGCV